MGKRTKPAMTVNERMRAYYLRQKAKLAANPELKRIFLEKTRESHRRTYRRTSRIQKNACGYVNEHDVPANDYMRGAKQCLPNALATVY